jgi:hypothetical protein
MRIPIHLAAVAIAFASLSACAEEDAVPSDKNILIVETDGFADEIDNELLKADEVDGGNSSEENR